jgi:TPR repeat protein
MFLLAFVLLSTQVAYSAKTISSHRQVKQWLEQATKYASGIGVRKDYVKAAHYMQLAAAEGDARGEGGLGYMYYAGQGVRRNYAAAVHYFELAAAQGDPDAEANLGAMYERGLGVSKNYATALHYYQLAARQDNALGIIGADRVSKLTGGAVARAARPVQTPDLTAATGSADTAWREFLNEVASSAPVTFASVRGDLIKSIPKHDDPILSGVTWGGSNVYASTITVDPSVFNNCQVRDSLSVDTGDVADTKLSCNLTGTTKSDLARVAAIVDQAAMARGFRSAAITRPIYNAEVYQITGF